MGRDVRSCRSCAHAGVGVRCQPPSDEASVRPKDWLDRLELGDKKSRMDRIGPPTMLVAYAIARYADWTTGENAYPSNATIARNTRLNRATVNRHVGILRDLGFLTQVAAQPGQVVTYRLAFPLWITDLGVTK